MSVLYDEMMDSLEEIQEHISESNYDGSSFDENSYGCRGTCSGGCSGSCSGECDSSCAGSCESGCSGGCEYSCSGTCEFISGL